jgi:CheY-like chemotaxis protein
MARATLRTLLVSGYRVTTAETATEGLELIHHTKFDCILIDIAGADRDDYGGLAEIRQFVRTSAVALMVEVPVDALIREALKEGSIERVSVPALCAKLKYLPRPVLVVGAALHTDLMQAMVSKHLLFSSGTTLQFAMNLLVDGWCQFVLLIADLQGITAPDELAIFRQVKAKHLAILASVLPRAASGIICIEKPQKPEDYLTLFEQMTRSHKT